MLCHCKLLFYRGGTYVVRWRYVVSSTGRWSAEKSKTTGDLKSVPNGRERTAYFLWTGRDSTVNEKGASALMATEIDKEVGQQVHTFKLSLNTKTYTLSVDNAHNDKLSLAYIRRKMFQQSKL